MRTVIIGLGLFAQGVYAQSSSSRVLGIGIGTLIIIIAVIFSILWCLACRNSSKPQLYSLFGLLVPGILILAFALTPKQSQRQSSSIVTDGNFIPHIVFMVLSLVGFLIPCLFLVITDSFSYKKAKNVSRSGIIMREQQQQKKPLEEHSEHRSQQLEVYSRDPSENRH